jgi:hypothetical protein
VRAEERGELRVRAVPDAEARVGVRRRLSFEARVERVERRDDERRLDEIVHREARRFLEPERADPVEDEVARVARLLGERLRGVLAERLDREPQRGAVGKRHEVAARVIGKRRVARRHALDDASRDLAQHGVHESARARSQAALRPLDACVDRGSGRHAVEEQDLRGAREERRLDRLFEQRPVLREVRPHARDQREVAAHDRVLDRARERRVAGIKHPADIELLDVQVGKAHRLRENALERDLAGLVSDGRLAAQAFASSGERFLPPAELTPFFGELTALPAPFLSAVAMSVFSQVNVPLPPSPGSRPKWPWLEVDE